MILDEILETKREEVARLRAERDALASLADAAPPPRGFTGAIVEQEAVSVIAEFKRRSPSAGEIDAFANPRSVARGYEQGGAAAISVLTDGPFFAGSMDDLAAAREACSLPLLRKDFIVDPVQLLEARAGGADAVLLIARVLEDSALEGLLDEAAALGLAALVEVHDERELSRAIDAGAEVLGVNARDLTSFEVDLEAGLELVARVPGEKVAVAESGIGSREDVLRAGRAGADAVLVGSWLMRRERGGTVEMLVGERRLPRRTAAPDHAASPDV